MARWQSLPLTLVCCALAAGELVAQAPGPLATPTERLDYLLSQWRGQTAAHVREGQVTIHPGGRLLCVVRFLIDDAEKVARTARQGGGQECWEQWRRYEP